MRRKLIAGNWKMHGSLAANTVLLSGIKVELPKDSCEVTVCVPAPFLMQCRAELTGTSISWGGQDLSAHESGAYTGEVSGLMLRDIGSTYVIVGHSERRTYHAEDDGLVAKKALRSVESGLRPIVCVGESLQQREAGETAKVVTRQINAVLEVLNAEQAENIVVAYEPVWAIGTGKTATPEMAQEVHAVLRERLAAKAANLAGKVRILYGGSMKPENAADLMSMPDIDGGLIGGAALKAPDFLAIIRAAC